MTKSIFEFGFISLLLLSKCDKFPDQRYAIMIDNNSKHNIQFYKAASGAEHIYPDTAIFADEPAMQEAVPNSRRYLDSSRP